MSPFEDFDLDILKIQNLGGINPLEDDTGGGSNQSSVPTSLPPTVWEGIATMVSKGRTCLH